MNALPEGYRREGDWVIDGANNRWLVTETRSETECVRLLKTCTDCIDSTDCSYCAYCTNCRGCTNCTNCTDCTYCTNCRGCTNCTNCTDCTDCTDCAYCAYCTYCTYCVDCTYCADCKDCTGSHQGETIVSPIPAIPDLHKRVYAAARKPGALDMSNWHCGTAHCWAGHVVNEAGAAGYVLEQELKSTAAAAILIARASGAPISPVLFYTNNADALENMRIMAGETA